MSKTKVAIGVLVGAALYVCAIGAPGASAMTLHECLNTTETSARNNMATTMPHPTEYTTNKCDVSGAGSYWRIPTVGPQTINNVASGASTLKATIAGVVFELECANQSGSGTSENVETEGFKHVKGTALVVSYETCKVVSPFGCLIPETITTNSLKSTTVNGTMQQKYEPESGTSLMEITVSGASCPAALKGSKKVTGTVSADVTESTGTQEFTATSGSALNVAGQPATFLSKNTFATSNGTKVWPTTP